MTPIRPARGRLGRALAVLAALAASASCAGLSRESRPAVSSRLTFGACPRPAVGVFAQGIVTCGLLHVPENRARTGSRLLDLPFTILRAETPHPGNDPILVLTGGPGGSAHVFIGAGFMRLEDFRTNHDIIVLEQRGTGLTSVPLLCGEVASHPITEIERPALTACRDRLRNAGVDFAGYDTAANAQDFVDLGRLLGVRRWTLLANSYGVRLALVLMRDHPVSVRAAVLDAAYPLTMNVFFTAGDLQGFSHVVSACNQDSQCAGDHPRLRDRFIRAVERLDQNPITIRGQRFGGELVLAVLRVALGSPASIQRLPAAIDHAADGDLEPLLALGSMTQSPYPPLPPPLDVGRFFAHGAYALTECRDSFYHAPPLDSAEAPTGGLTGWPRSVVAANARLMAHQRTMCEIFDPGASLSPIRDSVHSAIPALVLNGEFDGGTTAEMGRLVARGLTNATHVVTRGRGHSSLTQPCIRELIRSFIATPERALDLACTQHIAPLQFD